MLAPPVSSGLCEDRATPTMVHRCHIPSGVTPRKTEDPEELTGETLEDSTVPPGKGRTMSLEWGIEWARVGEMLGS